MLQIKTRSVFFSKEEAERAYPNLVWWLCPASLPFSIQTMCCNFTIVPMCKCVFLNFCSKCHVYGKSRDAEGCRKRQWYHKAALKEGNPLLFVACISLVGMRLSYAFQASNDHLLTSFLFCVFCWHWFIWEKNFSGRRKWDIHNLCVCPSHSRTQVWLESRLLPHGQAQSCLALL